MKNVKSGHKAPVVCLDAGHYGKYNAYAIGGGWESQQMWKLHLLLKKALEEYGIKVITTRANQRTDLDLYERGRKAKDADLFISLHSNADSKESTSYVVAMYQVDDNCGKMDEASKEFAKLLADCVGKVMGAKAQTWSTKGSYDRDGNGYKDDYYGVLRGAHAVKVPGVIIEHGFHTNKAQADWLMKDANLAKLAEAEAKTIAKWFDVEKPAAAPSAPAPATKTVTATNSAKSGPLSSLKGTYKVTAKNLNVRHGAGAEKGKDGKDKFPVMVTVKENTKVECYGYYTVSANGVKWLYIKFDYNGVTYIGFASSNYLAKV